jgi:antitoxin component YwqK of YwqJK toxin-antitoxin module
VKGEKDGLWGYFHRDGDGMKEEKWDNGKLLSLTDFTDNNGDTHSSGSLKNGNGLVINYYADGEVFSQGDYVNGMPNGNWTFYDEKGRKVTSGTLKDGVKEGAWQIFSRYGQVIEVELYENGELTRSSRND